jgi:hypothetical protein
MSRILVALLLLTIGLTGCRPERALLRDLGPDAPMAEYTVQVPEGYEVRSVGFGAGYDTSVSGGGYPGGLSLPVSGSSSQRPYLHVYAVEQATGQEVLLLYGDIRRRVEPVVIIRLVPGGPLRVGG